MGVPTFDAFIFPLAKVLFDHPDGLKAAEAHAMTADELSLTPEQRSEYVPSGTQLVYKNRIGWAHDRMKRAGLSSCPNWGVWQLTADGRKLIAAHPDGFPDALLKELAYAKQVPGADCVQADGANVVAAEKKQTPVERIHDALRELNESLSAELLEVISSRPPAFFERLVLRVLHAMGYGADEADLVQTPLSHDGGIDGVISLDRLGLEKVYVQAKKWDPEETIQKPEIQKFYGALAEKGSKGVFITTARFSPGARTYAKDVKKIVLVDGRHLAALMIEHRVGVTVQQTVRVCRLDSDYFDEG